MRTRLRVSRTVIDLHGDGSQTPFPPGSTVEREIANLRPRAGLLSASLIHQVRPFPSASLSNVPSGSQLSLREEREFGLSRPRPSLRAVPGKATGRSLQLRSAQSGCQSRLGGMLSLKVAAPAPARASAAPGHAQLRARPPPARPLQRFGASASAFLSLRPRRRAVAGASRRGQPQPNNCVGPPAPGRQASLRPAACSSQVAPCSERGRERGGPGRGGAGVRGGGAPPTAVQHAGRQRFRGGGDGRHDARRAHARVGEARGQTRLRRPSSFLYWSHPSARRAPSLASAASRIGLRRPRCRRRRASCPPRRFSFAP